MFENFIFMFLKRAGREIYFHQNGGECDFIIKNGLKITSAIQSCYKLDEKNRNRELDGLMSAMKKFNLKEGFIVTKDQKETIVVDKKTLSIITTKQFMRKFGIDSENL